MVASVTAVWLALYALLRRLFGRAHPCPRRGFVLLAAGALSWFARGQLRPAVALVGALLAAIAASSGRTFPATCLSTPPGLRSRC